MIALSPSRPREVTVAVPARRLAAMQWLATCDGDTFAVATAVLDVIVSLDDADREDRDAYETALLSHVAASRPELLALAAARYCREVQP